MYLKGIEVAGFKSFAKKTEFQFEDGITGIVGPNGSGKSNIADAMRWVLGEQSAKQLRGSNMQDVIFAGTENRRAQGYAYVNIIFDNSDYTLPLNYDEITIGRRVYRSGESEYLINSSTCRLKDVQELFYDTGIGKEGYSIIGQGQIDRVLSGKPEEKRELFDEAAGIVKYKKRKNEAINRLDKEEESLVRIKDILSELTKQEEPLSNQADKARKYLKLYDELKKAEIIAYLKKAKAATGDILGVDQKLEIIKKDILDLSTQSEGIKNDYSNISNLFESIDKELDDLRKSLDKYRTKRQEQITGISILKEQISSEKERIKLYENQQHEIVNKQSQRSDEIKDFSLALKSVKDNVCAEERRCAEIQSKIDHSENDQKELEKNISECEEELTKLNDKKQQLLIDNQKYDTLSEQIILRTSEYNGKILKAKSQEEEALHNISAEKSNIKKLEESISKCKEKQESTRKKAGKYQEKLSIARKDIYKKQETLHKVRARYDSLSNMAERYEGYGMSIKKLMEKKSDFTGIKGVLANLIIVDEKYETAIETALGQTLQNIVTDNESTAKACIEYLKSNKFGRATFLPVTTIKARGDFKEKDALSMEGVCGTADTLVHSLREYSNIISFLLKKVLVVDNMENALKVAKKFKYSFRIVTLDGESLNAGGSISGGAFKNNSNLLGRKREFEQLEKSLKSAESEYKNVVSDIKKYEQKLNIENENIRQLHNEMQSLQLEFGKTELKQRQNRNLLDSAKDDILNLEKELEEIISEKRRLRQERKDTVKIVEEVENSIHNVQIKEDEYKTSLDANKDSINKLMQDLVDAKISFTAEKEKLMHLEGDIERNKNDQEDLLQQIEDLKSLKDKSLKNVKIKEDELLKYEYSIAEADKNISIKEKEINEKSKFHKDNTTKQQELFNKQESLSLEIASLEKEEYRLIHKKESLEEQIERETSYLWEEYELTPVKATKLIADEEFEEEYLDNIQDYIQKLKIDIKNLGNINPNAVDEYDELSKRLNFMRSQYDDLVHAKENLILLIEQLNSEMQAQFTEKFGLIQKEFDKVFKELFGGGHGKLELAESDNMLEAGVIINVQPPGKKLQNMMQLSGGERALTAISLLFAIQNLKPSPFCILDEIEAALDDANVDRFAGYLSKLKKNTQFIVITHRRGTMLIADQLYGVTMQEKGISSLVSVDLTDADEMK